MRILFIYPAFERHAQSHPELGDCVPCNEYIGSPSLGIASVAACTPEGMEVGFVDDRIHPVTEHLPEADLYALSFFTPAATRALEIGDMLQEMGKPVVAGGIFGTVMPEVVQDHCTAVVIGEGEPIWPQICRDAAAGQLKPRYQADGPANLNELPAPDVDLYMDAESAAFAPYDYPLQLSRGCPFHCDACVLPRCMGSKVRFFPENLVWKTLDRFVSRGKRCCLTEDTTFFFARRFRAFLQKVAERRRTVPIQFSYVGTSMLMLLNIEGELLDNIRQAGVSRFYIVCGFDPITRAAFGPGDPGALARARECVWRCQEYGLEPYVSFLVGNEEDEESTFDRILDFADCTGLNIAEFAVATPYPGTPMWDRMLKENRILDRTWKHYNDSNVVFRPNKMSPEQLQEGYFYLWQEFYRTRQHLRQADETLNTIQF